MQLCGHAPLDLQTKPQSDRRSLSFRKCVCAPADPPPVQKTFEKEPDLVPIANKSRALARVMTEPTLKQNVPRIEQDLALMGIMI